MKSIPRTIVDLRTSRRLQPVKLQSEKEYDQLVVDNSDLLAELLFEAGAIDEGSDVIVLGRQIGRIDVLLAEVTAAESKDFRRLILVENKLLKNPEAKRTVIAQILEYASTLNEDVEDLLDAIADLKVGGVPSEWFQENREAIEHCLTIRDFVLVVGGDEIHPNVERIVRSFARKGAHDPLMIADLCLVSWAIYEDPGTETRILVPNLVGVVTQAERKVTIRVEVRTPAGGNVPAKITQIESHPVGSADATEEDFFAQYRIPKFGKEAVVEWQRLAQYLMSMGIPGLNTRHSSNGRPILSLISHATGAHLPLLQPRREKRAIRDALDRRVWESVPKEARTEFVNALLQTAGATMQPKSVFVPLAAAAGESARIGEAVRKLANVVQQSSGSEA